MPPEGNELTKKREKKAHDAGKARMVEHVYVHGAVALGSSCYGLLIAVDVEIQSRFVVLLARITLATAKSLPRRKRTLGRSSITAVCSVGLEAPASFSAFDSTRRGPEKPPGQPIQPCKISVSSRARASGDAWSSKWKESKTGLGSITTVLTLS